MNENEKNSWVKPFLHIFGYGLTAFICLLAGGLLMLVAVSAVSGVSPLSLLKVGKGTPSALAQKITINARPQTTDNVVAVTKKLKPSVVNIRTKTLVNNSFHLNLESTVLGSGVIFRQDGYIITNNHVIEGAKEIIVTIGADDVPATLVGGDAETDIAVLKVDKKGLPAAELGSSKNLQVGELAVAIGSPFGFEHTVTTGIISGLNRTMQPDPTQPQIYTNLIQTDAAINPGNSGGALANSSGQVVGINTLILSQSGGSEGLGFAIPIETAKSVANQLINKGTVVHPYLGINGGTVDADLAASLNLSTKSGAIIQQVGAGSPAEQAGLQKNDIIVKFDNQDVKTWEDLISVIRDKNIGDKVAVHYYRGADIKDTTVTLADKPK